VYPCKERYSKNKISTAVEGIYCQLYQYFGPQDWWPADNAFETAIGAILTQAVSWKNVQKAITNLKKAGVMSPVDINNLDNKILAGLIKPSGYYNMKTKKIKCFCKFLLETFNGKIELLQDLSLKEIRPRLLNVYGIGPETADSILLYAVEKPVFVVDAYTRRIFHRAGLIDSDIPYDELQQLFMCNFKPSAKKYNEYHALLVALGKNICKKRGAICSKCPLG